MVSSELNPIERILTSCDSSYSILNTIAFFQDQVAETSKAQFRSWVQTMALEPSFFTNLLIAELILATQRGLDTRLIHDAYSDFVTANTFNHLPFLLNKRGRSHKKQILEERKQFVQHINNHLSVRKTNIPQGLMAHTPLPGVMGRDHKKISIIDNIGYLGGVNFTPLDETRVDLMLKTTNQNIVGKLEEIFMRSFCDEPAKDIIAQCDQHNVLLVDSGRRGTSIIMDHTFELIRQENDRVTLVSPYVPSGKLRQLCNAAVKRGVQVEIVTSGSEQLGKTQIASQLVHGVGQRKPLFKIHRFPGVVHAKILLLNDHTAIIGSHNFDELFVRLGTEEISLLTQQPEIIQQLQMYVENMINAHV